MNFKAAITELHPDFNGGDASRIADFTALMAARRQQAIEDHVCECGCGRKTYNAKASQKVKRFFSRPCFMRARYYKNALAACLVLLCASASALELRWLAPTNTAPLGYVVFHGTSPRAYSELYSVGNSTNWLYQGTLVDGANYFAVAALGLTNGALAMSTFSNEAIITNTPTIFVVSYLFGSTNLGGRWLPVQTNRLILAGGDPQHFFRSGGTTITRTNLLTLPTP